MLFECKDIACTYRMRCNGSGYDVRSGDGTIVVFACSGGGGGGGDDDDK